ncbi:MAG: hypothetical protein SFV51_00600 [Bryobacteraceae bacterium]|nr:hypothetical protein [Bryobacteraceae bacterium]
MMWLFALAMFAQEAAPTPAGEFETERLRHLMAVRRIYVEKLTGENADHIRDAVMAALQESKLFIVTENQERADATLRGSTQHMVYTDTFQYGESTSTRGTASSGRGATRTGRTTRSAGIGVTENESARIAERREQASASLRLVNADGDVIWSTTQESRGAKFRGAAADVANKVALRLLDDYHRARKAQPQ